MQFLGVTFVLLVLFPVIVAATFRSYIVERKLKDLLGDLRKLRAFDSEVATTWGGEQAVRDEIQQYYSRTGLAVPVLLLTAFYAMGFLVLWAYLNVLLAEGPPWPFSRDLLWAARPMLMAFLAAYLFNVGTTIRRLYLSDVTENVFWSSINRLLLAVGLAVVIATAFQIGKDPGKEINQSFYFIFFGVGFLANIFLQWVMENGMQLVNINKPKTNDLPLQMVQGINMWREHRLEEEGIESVQNLATADVFQLAVKTHYNLRTLVDWMDQAILLDRLGERALTLSKECLIAGAIDMAWKSPEFNNGDTTRAKLIADKLVVHQSFVEDLMNGLFEDAHVRTLWTLWQTKAEF